MAARNLLNHQQRVTGAVLAVAERRKHAAFPELLRRGLQRLCVLASEIGGRWNDESLRLVAQLVRSRALRAPAPHRGAATQGWCRRWWGLLMWLCKTHTCCHFARVAARLCRNAWRAGTASAGRPARRVPARAQLPSRCSPSAVPWLAGALRPRADRPKRPLG